MAKFELKKTRGKQFLFNLIASNGRIILTSEQYKQKKSALNGIDSVRKNAGADKNFERKQSKKGEPYFVLLAKNKQVIGRSEMYASKKGVEKGIASVKKNAKAAKLSDLTE